MQSQIRLSDGDSVEDWNEFLGRASLTLAACNLTVVGAAACGVPGLAVEAAATGTDFVLAYDKCVADIDYGGECLYKVVFAALPFVTKSLGDDLDEVASEYLRRRGLEPIPAVTRESDDIIQAIIFHVFDDASVIFDD